jgi:IclR family acetate operon transcriptional repressor
MRAESSSPVASVDRALRIMAVVGGSSNGISLDQLSGQLDIPKSSLHRILAALKYRSFVAQPEPGGFYFLGTELLATAFRFYDMLDLRALVHPLLERLAAELGGTVFMAVLDGTDLIYQDVIHSPQSIRPHAVVGERDLAHATAAGKALLAWTYPTDDALRSWAAPRAELPMATDRTISSVADLALHLAEVRARGYACDHEENEMAVRSVAVPIFLGRLVPVAAVSVSLIGTRTDQRRLAELGEFLSTVTLRWYATSKP